MKVIINLCIRNHEMIRNKLKLFFLLFLLYGCGSSDSPLTPTQKNPISISPANEKLINGIVADGYISSALVVIDKNGNYSLDSDENYTYTDTNGRFKDLIYTEGTLIAFGGYDSDTSNFLGRFSLYTKLSTYRENVMITPITSVAASLNIPNDINKFLGIDPSIDIFSVDPVANKSKDDKHKFLYEKGNQIAILAHSQQTLIDEFNGSSSNTNDYYKIISDNLLSKYIENENQAVDIEQSVFIENIVGHSVRKNTQNMNDDIKTNLKIILNGIVPSLKVLEDDLSNTALQSFALSTMQNDIKSVALKTIQSSKLDIYEKNILSLIAEDQSYDKNKLGWINRAPFFVSHEKSFKIAENTQEVATFLANDNDGDSLTYSLSGADAASFEIDSNGALRLEKSADYEIKNNYSVDIVANDGATQTSLPVTLSVINTEEKWIERGSGIEGTNTGDNAYYGGMSDDGSTIAIAGWANDDNAVDAGEVRVFDWNGSNWVKRGASIYGKAENDGLEVADLSSDGNTVAVGTVFNDDNGEDSGHIRVFDWNGSAWTQRGNAIEGAAADDRAGYYFHMSKDTNVLAAGSQRNDENGNNSGHVRVFKWNGTNWIQQGASILGKAAGDYFTHVSLSDDGATLATGSWWTAINGYVRVFDWNGTAWVQRGNDLVGDGNADGHGVVSITGDGSSIAVGAWGGETANGNNSGYVRVYDWNGSAWSQRGNRIIGDEAESWFGSDAVISDDGNILAVSAPWHDGNGNNSGKVQVFYWNGTAWTQRGSDIFGETVNFTLGQIGHYGDRLPNNGNTFSVGGLGGADYTNKVRIFDWKTVASSNLHAPVITSSSIFTRDECPRQGGWPCSWDYISEKIGTITASDNDAFTNLSFSISGNDAKYLYIGADSGDLYFHRCEDGGDFCSSIEGDANHYDYESEKKSYSVTVSVKDGVHTTNQNITIDLNNVNDNGPRDSFAELSVYENQYSAGKLEATDADGDDIFYSFFELIPLESLGSYSERGPTGPYKLSSSNNNGEITLNAVTGEMTFNELPNYEIKSRYVIKYCIYNGEVGKPDGGMGCHLGRLINILDVAE